ncbi:aldo/keto reductase [Halolactibacillus miurensis]|uniref:Aldo/keto reductase n=1 Tax=Halolactibacillus miurensis TaxID=306541 RepID=A0A1I6UDH2_9BACI|nr:MULTISPECIES: aldo/keto reductase family protein [Halolactibacillus]GEM05190.1 aldo/keto reductase [Halolactibacillus miurensis]SFS99428.1 voltage-dependent potassium channel beta subunit, animal [Halolactibacillus miurensis]
MQYRYLGKSGLQVSELALGSWLTYGKAVGNETAEACIDRAYEHGINFFDTANAYEQGEAERVLGKALQKYQRSSYVVATKVFFPMGEGVNYRGLSRKHIIEQCDQSLKRLDLDYIDLYQCHRPDPHVPLEETMMALDDLVRAGKILYKGVSEFSSIDLERAQTINRDYRLHPLISNQPIYNMIERYIEEDVIDTSHRNGIGQIVFSPLAQGVLTGKYKPNEAPPKASRAANDETNFVINSYFDDRVLQAVESLGKIAAANDFTMAQLALRWILRQDNVASAIIGASRTEQIDENVEALHKPLTEDLLVEIDRILETIKDFHPMR